MAVITTSRPETSESLQERFPRATVYVLELIGAPTKETFFRSVAQALPMDPPLGPGHKWDAFSDSLFGGFLASGDCHVAIYWADVGAFESADSELFAIACEVLQDVDSQLQNPNVTQGCVVTLDVILYREKGRRLPQGGYP